MDERTEDRARQVLMDQLAHYHGEPNGAWDVLADDLLSALTEANVTLSTPGGPSPLPDLHTRHRGRVFEVRIGVSSERLLAVAEDGGVLASLHPLPVPDVAREAPEGDRCDACGLLADDSLTCTNAFHGLHARPPAAPAATTCDGSGYRKGLLGQGVIPCRGGAGCPSCRPEAEEGQ